MPISPKGPEKAPEQHAELMGFVDKAVAALRKEGTRVHVDTRFNLKPGAKFYEWEKRGVPIRMECGPRDVEAGTLLCARRTGGDKFPLALDDSFAQTVSQSVSQSVSRSVRRTGRLLCTDGRLGLRRPGVKRPGVKGQG